MTLHLSIDILSFWRVGTGKGVAGRLDAMCHRDELGFPILPGKNLRGLLRDAVAQAHALCWTAVCPDALFGSRAGVHDDADDLPDATVPGVLRVGNAMLPSIDMCVISENPERIAQLFAVRRATAMVSDRGVAMPRSLRFEEVAVPVGLHARLDPMGVMPADWQDALIVAAPLIRAIGSGRTRGLGRCRTVCSRVEHGGKKDA
jgi:hypothetical protein